MMPRILTCRLRLFLGAVFLTITDVLAAPATVISGCDEGSLRSAMEQGGDFVFGCDGVIRLTAPLVVARAGTLDGAGRKVTLDGGETNRLIEVRPGVQFILRRLVLVRGRADQGGAIFNDGGDVRVQDCQFTANRAVLSRDPVATPAGGAVFSSGGSLQVVGGVFQSNRCVGGGIASSDAAAVGGAVALLGATGEFQDCVFLANGADGGTLPGFDAAVAGPAWGGAIFATNSSCHLERCRLALNSATAPPFPTLSSSSSAADARGGAIASLGRGILTLRSSEIAGNGSYGSNGGRNGSHGAGLGGGLYADTPVQVEDCRWITNRVVGGGGGLARAANGEGGALYLRAGGTVDRSVFLGNNARAGEGCSCGLQGIPASGDALGGALFTSGPLSVTAGTFVSNRVFGFQVFGGAVLPLPGGVAGGALYSLGDTAVTNCTFYQNLAVAQASGTLNATLYGPARGAALHAGGGTLALIASTLVTNLAEGASTNVFPSVTLAGTVRAGIGGVVLAGGFPANLGHGFQDLGGNLSSDGSAEWTQPTSLAATDPGLDTPVVDRALAWRFPPRPGSPALDRVPPGVGSDSDQFGVPRPIGPRADAGAVEWVPPGVIAVTGDGAVAGRFVARPSTAYVVQGSADFVAWDVIGQVTANDSGVVSFVDRGIPGVGWRFYRLAAPAGGAFLPVCP